VRRYVQERGLPFFILVDEDRAVTKQYGAWQRINYDAWNIARPAVFVIEKSGVIRAVWVGETQAEFPSPEEIMKAMAGWTGLAG
jgi:peroxiredoxin